MDTLTRSQKNYAKHKESILTKQRERDQANKENKKIYYQENKERIKLRNQQKKSIAN